MVGWAKEKSDGKPLTAKAIREAEVEFLEAEPDEMVEKARTLRPSGDQELIGAVKAGTMELDEAVARITEPSPHTVLGKGVFLANEAIDVLKRIPQNDGLRWRAFQIVDDWLHANWPAKPTEGHE